MMTSWHGNTFRISGHFVRGILWFPAQRASDVELWCFIWCQTFGLCRVAGDLSRLMRLPSFQKRRDELMIFSSHFDQHLCTFNHIWTRFDNWHHIMHCLKWTEKKRCKALCFAMLSSLETRNLKAHLEWDKIAEISATYSNTFWIAAPALMGHPSLTTIYDLFLGW